MFKYVLLIALVVFLPIHGAGAAYLEADDGDLIDFYLVYPIVKLDNEFVRRQKVTAGVGLNYQFIFGEHFGLSLNPNSWFVPVRDPGGAQAMLLGVGFEAGPLFRIAPRSYFDPTLTLLSGATLIDAGKRVKAGFVYPVSGKFGVNLYRSQQKFSDPALALHAFVDARYYFRDPEPIEPWYLGVGLAFRGSF